MKCFKWEEGKIHCASYQYCFSYWANYKLVGGLAIVWASRWRLGSRIIKAGFGYTFRKM